MDEEIINKPKFNFTTFIKQNKIKLILTTIIIILSILAFFIIGEFKNKKIIEISEKYNKAKILIEQNNSQKSLKLLEEILSAENNFYSPSALNLIIDNNMIKDKNKVLSYFDKIISDSGLDLETKNLFIFKKIIYLGDEISENDLLQSLKPIIKSNSLYKNTMIDYIKKYYLSKGEFNKAKEFEVSKD